MVYHPKKHGGLGVLNLRVQNEAMLLKYLHKFYNRMDIPWVTLLWNTYYNTSIPHATDPCGSPWCRDILQLSPSFRGVSRIEIRRGTTALFWKDLWLDGMLSEIYPRAYSYTMDEDASVRNFLTTADLRDTFQLPFSVQAHAEVRHMQADVADTNFSDNSHDRWVYVWGAKEFKAKAYYDFFFREVQAHAAFKWL